MRKQDQDSASDDEDVLRNRKKYRRSSTASITDLEHIPADSTFRVDILDSVKAEIHEERREEAVLSQQPFCYEYFEEIMIDGVYLSKGNRCDFKVATQLGHYLFDYDDQHWNRKHWEDRPFRKMYKRARTALDTRLGALSEVARAFRRRFWRCLYAYHWVLPHPAGGVLLQTTKEGHRMWYSIRRGEPGQPHADLWEWARKDWQPGRPPDLPDFLAWDREQWEEWIERHRGHGTAA